MRGFDGSSAKWPLLWAALEALDAVFPPSAEKGTIDPWGIVYPEDEVVPKAMDLVVRKWKHERLRMPLRELRDVPVPPGTLFGWLPDEAIFVRYSIRRFAFFVPALLADWVSPEGTTSTDALADLVRQARLDEAAVHKDAARSFTDEERRALAVFFARALDAALATSPDPPPALEPPPAEVCRLAVAFEVPVAPLLDTWLASDHPYAEEHLLRTAEEVRLVPPWDDEATRARLADRLADVFFRSRDPDRVSAAELSLRSGGRQ